MHRYCLLIVTSISLWLSVSGQSFDDGSAGMLHQIHFRGVIPNYQADFESPYVQLRRVDLVSGERNMVEAEIAEDGTFDLSLFLPFAQDVQLSTPNGQYHFWLRPGDSLVVQLPGAGAVGKKKGYTFSGHQDSQMNRWINPFMEELKTDQLAQLRKVATHLGEANTNTFLETLTEVQRELKDRAERFLERNDLTNTAFASWGMHHLQYTLGRIWLDRYAYSMIQHQPFEAFDRYFAHRTSFPLDNHSALHSSAYLRYLNTYAALKPEWSEALRKLGRDSMRRVLTERLEHYLFEELEGFPREVMLTQYLIACSRTEAGLPRATAHLSTYDSLVQTTFLHDGFMHVYQYYSDAQMPEDIELPASVQLLSAPVKTSEIIPYLRQKFTEDWLAVEIWATWCRPCLENLRRYAAAPGTLPSRRIRPVFIGIESPHNRWLSTIAEIAPPGVHLWLDALEHKDFTKYFRFSFLPARLLVSPNGEVFQLEVPPFGVELDAFIRQLRP